MGHSNSNLHAWEVFQFAADLRALVHATAPSAAPFTAELVRRPFSLSLSPHHVLCTVGLFRVAYLADLMSTQSSEHVLSASA